MRRGQELCVAARVAAVCVAVYFGYEVVQPANGHAVAASFPVFISRCVGRPVSYPIPKHPIISFGDSITEGYGASIRCGPRKLPPVLPASAHRVYTADTSYPGDLARLEQRTVLNYGVGGEVTSRGVPRLRSILRSIRPSTVFILEGVNDLWDGGSVQDTVANLAQMIRWSRKLGARPIVLTVLPVDRAVFPHAQSKVDALNTAIRRMAKHHHVRLIDSAARFLHHRPLSSLFRHADGRDDGIHPNDAGYRVLAGAAATGLGSHQANDSKHHCRRQRILRRTAPSTSRLSIHSKTGASLPISSRATRTARSQRSFES